MDSVNIYVNHPLNKSKAKAAFSFPRQSRLKQIKTNNKGSFYNLPSMKNNRACSLGYGSKTSLAKKDNSPPPGTYHFKSQFDVSVQKKSGVAFGYSRDKIKFASFIEQIQKRRRNPAPNSYRNGQSTLSKRGGRMAIRLPTQIDHLRNKKIPGPGAYNVKHLNISDSGTYLLSNYKNKSSPRYYNPEHQHRADGSRLKTLGPCTYETSQKQFGRFVLSKYKNSVAGSFAKSQRQGIIQKGRLIVPGFKYRSFSQFGEPKK